MNFESRLSSKESKAGEWESSFQVEFQESAYCCASSTAQLTKYTGVDNLVRWNYKSDSQAIRRGLLGLGVSDLESSRQRARPALPQLASVVSSNKYYVILLLAMK